MLCWILPNVEVSFHKHPGEGERGKALGFCVGFDRELVTCVGLLPSCCIMPLATGEVEEEREYALRFIH